MSSTPPRAKYRTIIIFLDKTVKKKTDDLNPKNHAKIYEIDPDNIQQSIDRPQWKGEAGRNLLRKNGTLVVAVGNKEYAEDLKLALCHNNDVAADKIGRAESLAELYTNGILEHYMPIRKREKPRPRDENPSLAKKIRNVIDETSGNTYAYSDNDAIGFAMAIAEFKQKKISKPTPENQYDYFIRLAAKRIGERDTAEQMTKAYSACIEPIWHLLLKETKGGDDN